MPEVDEDSFPVQSLGVTMLLADAAQVADGKLYILGGGLSMVGPRPQPLAVALRLSVPWDQANVAHQWRLDLIDEDGQPVSVRDKTISVNGKFEAGRPAGLRPGTPLGVALAINVTPLPLPPGRSYSFRLSIDDETQPEWRVSFAVRTPRTTST